MEKRILRSDRIRTLPAQWSWVDQRLIRMERPVKCDSKVWGLYLFLVTVSDRDGLSYYSDRSIMEWLNFEGEEFISARNVLIKADLIAHQGALYQVLSFPVKKRIEKVKEPVGIPRGGLMSIREVFQTLGGVR